MTAIVDMIRKARLLLIRRGASADDAEDLVQEAFARVQAYVQTQAVEVQEALLMRTAVNVSIDHARRKRRSPFDPREIDFAAVADAAPRQDEALRARQRLERTRAGLAQLSARARRILLAQRIEGLSYAEIAAREGMNRRAVEKQVARAVDFLTDWTDGW
jgi:RNA polymerase sigma-70 factor (ECF subfamily)